MTKAAINLNMPVLTQCVLADGQGESFVRYSFVHTDCGHILLDTVKLAEDGKSCVIRLYEYKNCSDDKAGLFFDRTVKRVTETNLCEEEEMEITVNGNGIAFAIGCYEIKTFKVYF